jgi:ADP-ribose pyrophosphatase YjhB (NUDIX family)
VARTEHFDDPDAPTANAIVVAVTVFVLDADQRVLLVHRTDNGLWALPGGAQDIGESVSQTAVRETKEESGIDVEVTGLVGIYSDPRHVVEFSNGEVRQQFSICFRARPTGGELATSDETSECRWAAREMLDTLAVHPSMRLRVDHGYEHRAQPYLG